MESRPIGERNVVEEYQALSPEQKTALASFVTDILMKTLRDVIEEQVVHQVRETLGSAEAITKKTGCTERVMDRTETLSLQWKEDPEVVILKGLNLYHAAREAEAAGNRLVVINDDDEILHDIVGVTPKRAEQPAPAGA
jgi:hypothetical protein